MYFRVLAMSLCLILGGCAASGTFHNGGAKEAQPQSVSMRGVDLPFTLVQMDNYVQQVSRLDVAARQGELRRLQGNLAISVGERLELAYLLSLESASLDDLGQAQVQLEGLDTKFEDPALRPYVRLLQRTVAMESAYKQEKKRADDLQQKLRQLKELELELLKRSQAQPAQSK